MLNIREFSVEVNGQPLTCLLAEPNELSDRPALLLNFCGGQIRYAKYGALQHHALGCSSTRGTAPRVSTCRVTVIGRFRGNPEGLRGFCAEWRRGVDVFAAFVDEGCAVIDALIERQLASRAASLFPVPRGAVIARCV